MPGPEGPQPSPQTPGSASPSAIRGDGLARELRGSLPCARCGYNLQGLSVRSVCPECGTPVRGTILVMVDPHADELRPIVWRRTLTAALLLWALGALAAVGAVWAMRVIAFAATQGYKIDQPPWLSMVPSAAVLLSGIGALGFVRPHGGVRVMSSLAAAVGALAHAPLAYLMWQIYVVVDAGASASISGIDVVELRSLLRLGCAACAGVAILGVRPNARLLVSRSLVMRSGRVDRQTLLVMLLAVAIAALGDFIRLLTPQPGGETMDTIGMMVIASGSMLLTVGLIGVVIDTLRLRYSIMADPLSIDDVLGHGAGAEMAHTARGHVPVSMRPPPAPGGGVGGAP